MLIPSASIMLAAVDASLSRRVNANSQHALGGVLVFGKLIKKGEC